MGPRESYTPRLREASRGNTLRSTELDSRGSIHILRPGMRDFKMGSRSAVERGMTDFKRNSGTKKLAMGDSKVDCRPGIRAPGRSHRPGGMAPAGAGRLNVHQKGAGPGLQLPGVEEGEVTGHQPATPGWPGGGQHHGGGGVSAASTLCQRARSGATPASRTGPGGTPARRARDRATPTPCSGGTTPGCWQGQGSGTAPVT